MRERAGAMKWLGMTAAEQGQAIGAGELDPVELAEAYLDAATSHPMAPRIYARLTKDRARAEAIAAHDRARQGFRVGRSTAYRSPGRTFSTRQA